MKTLSSITLALHFGSGFLCTKHVTRSGPGILGSLVKGPQSVKDSGIFDSIQMKRYLIVLLQVVFPELCLIIVSSFTVISFVLINLE